MIAHLHPDHLDPAVFFRTTRTREIMLLKKRPIRAIALARLFKSDIGQMREDLAALHAAGLVVADAFDASHPGIGYTLTDEGCASVRWSSSHPPESGINGRWVGLLARAVCDFYKADLADLRRVEIGAPVVARSRICYALYSRGWSFERIDDHFGLPNGWAHRAVERWKRMRDELPPTNGLELRAWRKRHGLTQAQAAERLGVDRRTVIRAEQRAEQHFSTRMAVGRA